MGFLLALRAAAMARIGLLSGLLGGAPALIGGVARFLSTPFGQVVAAVAIAGGMFVWGDLHRARIDAAWHRAEVERLVEDARHRQQQRDAEIKTAVERDAGARLMTLEKLSTDLQGKVTAYEQELAKRGGDVCRLNDADMRRLRNL